MEENNSTSKRHSTNDDLVILCLIAGLIAAVLLFFIIVYSMVFGLSAAAIYFGAKLGSNGQLRKNTYTKVKDLETEKQEHLEHLKDEDEDLKSLIAGNFENKKMELYREDDRPEPLFKVDLDVAKDTVKRVVRAVKGR
jgi:hypothetical protein